MKPANGRAVQSVKVLAYFIVIVPRTLNFPRNCTADLKFSLFCIFVFHICCRSRQNSPPAKGGQAPYANTKVPYSYFKELHFPHGQTSCPSYGTNRDSWFVIRDAYSVFQPSKGGFSTSGWTWVSWLLPWFAQYRGRFLNWVCFFWRFSAISLIHCYCLAYGDFVIIKLGLFSIIYLFGFKL